jgi:hypothetical protein
VHSLNLSLLSFDVFELSIFSIFILQAECLVRNDRAALLAVYQVRADDRLMRLASWPPELEGQA